MDSKKFDVLAVGELNVDIILNDLIELPEVGKETLADSAQLSLGSSTAIFASNLSSLGSRVAFFGMIGDDLFGEFVLNKLNEKQVNTQWIKKSEQYATGITVVLNHGEDRAMITYPGVMQYLSGNEMPDDLLTQAHHLHFSSYFLQPGFTSTLSNLLKRAKRLGLSTSLDPQWDPKEEWQFDCAAILPYVDVFLPNKIELLNITGQDTLETAIGQLPELANSLVVKDGRRGSYLWDGEGIAHSKAFLNLEVADAIGAGDSFNAGFIFKYLKKKSLKECQNFGNLMGAISTTAIGGTAAFQNYSGVMKIAEERFNYNTNSAVTGEI